MSGNQNVLLICIGSEWQSLKLGLICPQFFGASGGEFKWCLAAVNWLAVRSLHLGVLSGRLSGVEFSSSSLDKSYGSNDDWQDGEVVADGMRLLLGKLWCWLTGTPRCLGRYSFSIYLGNACKYWDVSNVSSSGLPFIHLSHFLNDRNLRKALCTSAEMRSMRVVGVNSA